MFTRSQCRNAFLAVVAIVNLSGLVYAFAWQLFRGSDIAAGKSTPDEWLILNKTGLFMEVEDTSKYDIYGTQAHSEWLSTTPTNNGFVRVGEEHRYMLTAFGHQIHCVRVLRMAIVNPAHPDATSFHLSHCLSYLRAYALCNADLTLEKRDPLQQNFTSEGLGAVHVCHDWRRAYDAIQKNREEWIMDLVSKSYANPSASRSV